MNPKSLKHLPVPLPPEASREQFWNLSGSILDASGCNAQAMLEHVAGSLPPLSFMTLATCVLLVAPAAMESQILRSGDARLSAYIIA